MAFATYCVNFTQINLLAEKIYLILRQSNVTDMEELKYHYKYPHPAVTTDCVIFGFDGVRINVLLIQRGVEPYKDAWAFPGGFLKMDET